MIQSMTGYAASQGAEEGYRWSWELRSVNARGLDIRLRVPDWIDGLEATLRAAIGKSVSRGNVSLSLRVHRDEAETGLQLNESQLDRVMGALAEIENKAKAQGVTLVPSSAAEIVALRGVMETQSEGDDTSALKKALDKDLPGLIASFVEMRAQEGVALHGVLTGQLDEIAALTEAATDLLERRQDETNATFTRNLAKVLENTTEIDSDRLAQELAVLAVKSDVAEEVDRLRAHVAAARALLDAGEPVGRKLDFLMQEFNREANTLCSKAQMSELTEIGLSLKVLIDQMREQVQNVE